MPMFEPQDDESGLAAIANMGLGGTPGNGPEDIRKSQEFLRKLANDSNSVRKLKMTLGNAEKKMTGGHTMPTMREFFAKCAAPVAVNEGYVEPSLTRIFALREGGAPKGLDRFVKPLRRNLLKMYDGDETKATATAIELLSQASDETRANQLLTSLANMPGDQREDFVAEKLRGTDVALPAGAAPPPPQKKAPGAPGDEEGDVDADQGVDVTADPASRERDAAAGDVASMLGPEIERGMHDMQARKSLRALKDMSPEEQERMKQLYAGGPKDKKDVYRPQHGKL